MFVQATLPSDQRAGILTNSAFITSRGRSDGIGFLVPRGRVIAAAVLCSPPPSPGPELETAVAAAKGSFNTQTGREQVAYRQSIPLCASCHAFFDPYGLVLENYDNLGIYRTTDHTGKTVDATTMLPPILGGGSVTNAIQLAETLAASPAFTDCMASTMLQYALVQYADSVVELPTKGGCSTADVVDKYDAGSAKTFTALVRATTETPAFTLRRAAQ